MKKHIFTLMALAAALCACEKEQMTESEVTDPVVEPSAPLVFTATMEDAPESKATFDNTAKCASWEVGDQINLNNLSYKAITAGTNTTFTITNVTEEIRPTYIDGSPSTNRGDQSPKELVDDAGTNTKWCDHVSGDGLYIIVSAGDDCILNSIKLWNGGDTGSRNGRRWKDVKVYGSSSAEGPWGEDALLQSFTNLNLAVNNNGFAGELHINSSKEYKYYRVEVLSTMGESLQQMSDMKFVVSTGLRPTYVSSGNSGCYGNNPASNLVDDAGTSTRWCVGTDQKTAFGKLWNIVVSTGHPTVLKTIKVWNADNTADYPNRIWQDIHVMGRKSSVSSVWTEIKPYSIINLVANNSGLAGEIAINATEAYDEYRLNILNNKGDDYMQMADMKFVVSYPDPESPYTAYFPAALYNEGQTVLPSVIPETWADGKFNMPMYAKSNTTNLQFKNLCGVLKITVKSDQIASVKKIRVSSANKATSGEFTVNSSNAAVLVNPNAVDNTVTVVYDTAVPTTAEGTTFYVAVPAQTYQELKIDLSSDANFTKSMTTKSATDITVARNTIYPITFVNNSTPALPAGALPGEFTVNNEGKKIHFSKGNLQAKYDGTKYIWGFAEHQYDYIGGAAGNTTIDNQQSGNVVDLFGWSTPITSYGISTSFNYNYYLGEFVDWGKNIGDGNTWRTPTKDEWDYIFTKRTMQNSKPRYTLNIVYGGKRGVVLYPDNYAGSTLSGTISTLPEGVVFLPAAGFRTESSWSSRSGLYTDCHYWSSVKYDAYYAYILRIDSSGSSTIDGKAVRTDEVSRMYGQCVRLVTE